MRRVLALLTLLPLGLHGLALAGEPYDVRNTNWASAQKEKIKVQHVGSDRTLVTAVVTQFDGVGNWTTSTGGFLLSGTSRLDGKKLVLTLTSRTVLEDALESWIENLTGIPNVSVTLDAAPVEIQAKAKASRRGDEIAYKVKVAFTATAPGQPVVRGTWQMKGKGVRT